MSLKGTLEYAKLSISGFGAEVLLSEKLIDAIITELDKVEEMQKAFATIHGIASETFESPNQLELIRLTAVEHLKGVETL